jgi:hypothetical protein
VALSRESSGTRLGSPSNRRVTSRTLAQATAFFRVDAYPRLRRWSS